MWAVGGSLSTAWDSFPHFCVFVQPLHTWNSTQQRKWIFRRLCFLSAGDRNIFNSTVKKRRTVVSCSPHLVPEVLHESLQRVFKQVETTGKKLLRSETPESVWWEQTESKRAAEMRSWACGDAYCCFQTSVTFWFYSTISLTPTESYKELTLLPAAFSCNWFI